MKRVLIGIWIANVVLFALGLLTLHPIYGDVCQTDQYGQHYNCSPEHIIRVVQWRLRIAVTDSTLVTAIATIVIAVFTTVLAIVARQQSRDTKILQRAYISVVPLGIKGLSDGRVVAIVGFHNAGNLPARNVRWVLYWKIGKDPGLNDFPINDGELVGGILITQHNTAPKGSQFIPMNEISAAYSVKEDSWVFVWGRVKYTDGFGQTRHTDFCHRYNVKAFAKGGIPSETARYHEYGNNTDED